MRYGPSMSELMPKEAPYCGHYGTLSAASDFRDILMRTLECASFNEIDEYYIAEIVNLSIRYLIETGKVTVRQSDSRKRIYKLCKDSK